MANIFAITTATESVTAEVNGEAKATVVFTVTNNTAKPVRGIARAQVLDQTQEAWLHLEGEPEKDFPAGGTQQYAVNFKKPLEPVADEKTEPEEKYPFRLNVASAVRPDEDFGEGQIVTVIKPERKGKITGGGFPPWWVFLIIGIVVLAGLVVGIIFGVRSCSSEPKKTKVQVPDVKTKVTTMKDATKIMEDAGFVVAPAQVNAPNRQVNVVLDQAPAAGEEAAAGSTVTLTEAEKTNVPILKGQCAIAAMVELANANLKTSENMVGDMADIQSCVSKVQSTTPAERSAIAKGSTVTLTFNCVEKTGRPCKNINPKEIVIGTKADRLSPTEKKRVESFIGQ